MKRTSLSTHWLFFSLLLVVALVISACATPAPPASEAVAPAAPAEAAAPTAAPAAEAGLPYEGVEVNIITFTGPQIAEPLQRRAPDFQALTGAKVNVITVPFSDLYQKVLTDMATGTNSFDAFVFAPQWMADYVVPGYLEDLTGRESWDPVPSLPPDWCDAQRVLVDR